MGDFVEQLAGTRNRVNARISGDKSAGDELARDEPGFGDDGVELLGFAGGGRGGGVDRFDEANEGSSGGAERSFDHAAETSAEDPSPVNRVFKKNNIYENRTTPSMFTKMGFVREKSRDAARDFIKNAITTCYFTE